MTRLRNKNLNGFTSQCVQPSTAQIERIKGEILAIEDYIGRLNLALKEFGRLLNVYGGTNAKELALKTYCLSLSHWKSLDAYYTQFTTLKSYKINLSFSAPIFSLCEFLKQGTIQVQNQLQTYPKELQAKKDNLLQEQRRFDNEKLDYLNCLKSEQDYLSSLENQQESETGLTEAQTEQIQTESETAIAENEQKINFLNKYFPYILVGAGGLLFYAISEDKKKNKSKK